MRIFLSKSKLLCFVVSLLVVNEAYSEPIYYRSSDGENHEKSLWKVAEKKADFEVIIKDADVYEEYKVTQKNGKIERVERGYRTPSGDWGFTFLYHYDEKGILNKIEANYITFSGHEAIKDVFCLQKVCEYLKKIRRVNGCRYLKKLPI